MPSSSWLSRLVLAALSWLLISTVPSHAACDPSTDPDKSDIASPAGMMCNPVPKQGECGFDCVCQ